MIKQLRRGAVATVVASGLLVGGLGVTHAFAATG